MSELRETRLEKGKALAELGQGPYALRFEPSHRTAELQQAHADLPNGEEAVTLFHKEQPDLLVLDVMLPKLDGFAVCRRLRAESCVPINFLSALDAIAERVAGLDLGADDYLPKPFSPKELEARIATILRRVGRGSATNEPRDVPAGQGVLRVGDLVVDTNRRQVTRDGGG